MDINKKKLFEAIRALKKSELITLLEEAFDEMERGTRRVVFGELFNEYTKKERTAEQVRKQVKQFYKQSMAGDYYAPFSINSKNYLDVPEETDEWFDEIGDHLGFVSELVEEEEYETALHCFKLLYELIDRMEEGEEIVFADELGAWMIGDTEQDTENYIIAASKVLEDSEEYVGLLLPRLRRDSYFSFSEKVYEKIKKHANPSQLKAIREAVKAESIRVK